jgi:hypothetical protein
MRPVSGGRRRLGQKSRRLDPEKPYAAHRAGHLFAARGASFWMSAQKAEEWISVWEAEAALRGLDRHSDGFWRPAWDWIAEARVLRNDVPGPASYREALLPACASEAPHFPPTASLAGFEPTPGTTSRSCAAIR